MRIGIITFHNADNYGAVLQCFALQEYLRLKGHEVVVIDYRNPHIEQYYGEERFQYDALFKYLLTLRISPALRYLHDFRHRRRRHQQFEDFRHKYLRITSRATASAMPSDLDAYLIGSDQMWSIGLYEEFDPVFFGQFARPQSSRLFGYSISSNGDFASLLSPEQIRQCTRSFDALSFREQQTASTVHRLTGVEAPVTLDPVALTGPLTWQALETVPQQPRPYVCVYQARWPQGHEDVIEQKARAFAKKHELDLILIEKGNYSVEEFVSLIRHARCVFTSSFHACVFSVIFRVPLCAFLLHDGADERYQSLLTDLGLQGYLQETSDEIEALPAPYDEEALSLRLDQLRHSSTLYLDQILPV